MSSCIVYLKDIKQNVTNIIPLVKTSMQIEKVYRILKINTGDASHKFAFVTVYSKFLARMTLYKMHMPQKFNTGSSSEQSFLNSFFIKFVLEF